MAMEVSMSLLVIFVVLIYNSGAEQDQAKHHEKRAMGSMFQDILKSIKTNFVPGSKSKNQKGGGDSGDANSGGSSSGSWKNMIPDIAKAFIPDEDQGNSTSKEDVQDNDSSSNVTEVDPQATKVNAGVTENMGKDAKTDKQSPQDSGKQDEESQDDTQSSGKQDDVQDGGTKDVSEEESDAKETILTEKQNEKINEGITENMGDNVDSKVLTNGTTAESIIVAPGTDNKVQTEEHASADNGAHEEMGPLSWEEESQETDTENGSEKPKTLDDQTVDESGTVKVNAGVTENLGNDNVNPKPVRKTSPHGHDVRKNETVSTVKTLTFEKNQPLSWESESPEVQEEAEKQTR